VATGAGAHRHAALTWGAVMRSRRLSFIPVLMALLLALGTASADAAVFTFGNGAKPRVAVDAAGNGHFTWSDSSGPTSVFHYCRVPLGGTTCSATASRAPDPANTQNLDGGYAFLPGGARVLLLEARCCTVYAQKWLYSSSNGGTTFDAGVSPGFRNDNGAHIGGGAVYAPPGALGRPGESIATLADLQTIGLTFQVTGTTANPLFQDGFLMTSGNSYDGSLGIQGNTLVALWSTLGPENVFWRRWNGTGNVNDPAQWTPAAVVGPTNIDANVSVAYGPSGIYVAYNTGALSARTFVVRRFTGSGWGAPIAVSDTGGPVFGELHQDPTGRLHFAWQDSNGNLRYRYARTTANSSFTNPQTLSGPRPDGNFAGLKLASNAAGRGFVTWGFYGGAIKAAPFAPGEPGGGGSLAPVLGKSVLVAPLKGKVYVSLPPGAARAAASVPGLKGKRFVRLTAARSIPVKSYLDTRKGTVRLVSAKDAAGTPQSGDFSAGVFQVLQSRTGKGLTEARLKGGSFRRCGRRARRSQASAAASKRRIRRLKANAKGRFRTRGRYSSATVRGTAWETQDRCDGTLTRVTSGRVAVRDFRRKKTIVLRAKKRYLARARR
jgi:hypothetical protein